MKFLVKQFFRRFTFLVENSSEWFHNNSYLQFRVWCEPRSHSYKNGPTKVNRSDSYNSSENIISLIAGMQQKLSGAIGEYFITISKKVTKLPEHNTGSTGNHSQKLSSITDKLSKRNKDINAAPSYSSIHLTDKVEILQLTSKIKFRRGRGIWCISFLDWTV